MRRRGWLAAALGVVMLAGCGSSGGDPAGASNVDCVDDYDEAVDYFPDRVTAEYANGWAVRYENSYKVVTTQVSAAGGHAAAGHRQIEGTYVLVRCGTPAPELTGELAGATVIETPVTTLVDGGSVLYAALERLEVADSLVGVAEPFIGETEEPYLPEVSERLATGQVAELGYELNLELLAEADPDFYTNYAGDDQMFAQIEELGIPLVYFFPYTESPLGAAEHIKFLSLFFNAERRAQQVFDPIEERYLALRDRVAEHTAALAAPELPTVVSGAVGDGGEVTTREHDRFEPELIREAGGVHLPDRDGGGIASISFEDFIDLGADADFWLDLGFFPEHTTGADYLAADERLAALPAVTGGNTIHRIGPRGNDYFLSGALEVDRMLADFVSVLHPELLEDHELEFVQRIPAG